VQRNSALTTVRGPGGLPSKERARCGVGMGVGNESIHTDRREHRRMVAMKHTYAMAPESARSEFLRVCCLPVRIVPDAKRSVCWESTGRLSCHPSARDSSFPREYWLRKRERSFAGICTGVNEASTPSHHAMPDALPESVPPEGAPPIGHDPPASAGVHYSLLGESGRHASSSLPTGQQPIAGVDDASGSARPRCALGRVALQRMWVEAGTRPSSLPQPRRRPHATRELSVGGRASGSGREWREGWRSWGRVGR
jgi:hypothetical protein